MSTNPAVAAFNVAWINVRRLSRDRLGLFFVVVLPLLIILLFGVAGGGAPRDAKVGVLTGSQGPLATDLITALDDRESVSVTEYATRDELETAVRRRTVRAGVVLPEAYDDALADGDAVTVELIADPSGGIPSAVRTTVAGEIALENVRLQTAQVVDDQLGLGFEEGLELADEVSGPQGLVVETETLAAGDDDPELVDRAAAGNLVLFVFITSLVGSAALIETRRLGMARRMLAAPVTSTTILVGEALGRFAVALVQAAIVIVGAALLFGAQWHDPLSVWLVVALLSLVGTGAAMLMGAVFSNPEQASGVAVPLGIGMGMLGGCMWPREIVPDAMQTLGLVTPHAWAMDALDTILAGGAGVADIVPQLLVLAAFAVVVLAVAAWAFGRSLHRPAAA